MPCLETRGNSWLRNNRAELFFVACVSVPLWVIFEIYNKYSIHNWYYLGLPRLLLLRYFGYVWSFATILPAIFETADLVSSLRDRRAAPDRLDPQGPRRLGGFAWLAVAAGATMVGVPIFVHSTYLAAVFSGHLPDRSTQRRAVHMHRVDWYDGTRHESSSAGCDSLRLSGVLELLGRANGSITYRFSGQQDLRTAFLGFSISPSRGAS